MPLPLSYRFHIKANLRNPIRSKKKNRSESVKINLSAKIYWKHDRDGAHFANPRRLLI